MGREELGVEFTEFGGPVDTPGGCGEGCWTPPVPAVPEKLWAGVPDLGIPSTQVGGGTGEWLR